MMTKLSNIYNVSLCRHRLLGGLLYLQDSELLYATNKLTVPEEIRRLHLVFDNIASVEKAPLHTVRITMKDGGVYRFLVFSRERLLRNLGKRTGA